MPSSWSIAFVSSPPKNPEMRSQKLVEDSPLTLLGQRGGLDRRHTEENYFPVTLARCSAAVSQARPAVQKGGRNLSVRDCQQLGRVSGLYSTRCSPAIVGTGVCQVPLSCT